VDIAVLDPAGIVRAEAEVVSLALAAGRAASDPRGCDTDGRRRALTDVFGQKTYGVASSNRGVMVADDVNLVVTAAWMQDTQGRTWPDGVVPDEMIQGNAEAVLDRHRLVEGATDLRNDRGRGR
jgi:hypothetical protein